MKIFVVKDCFGTNHKAFRSLTSAFKYKNAKQEELNSSKTYLGKVNCVIEEFEL
jgi:hypothetical protein